MLIDSHAHLNDDRLFPYVQKIVNDMANDGLEAIVNVGYDKKSSLRGIEMADQYEKIYCTVGIHPHDAKTATQEDYRLFEDLYKNKKTVAIGEIGLDYYYDLSPREVQKRVFVEQLDLADFLSAPIVIHLREAYGDTYQLLKENRNKLKNGVLIHCYSGSKEMIEQFNQFDVFYSFGGAITFANAKDKPDVVRSVPIDRLLLETDCPYMTPVPFRGKTNYPAYVNLVAEKVAQFLDTTKEKVAEITTKNARNFYRKML